MNTARILRRVLIANRGEIAVRISRTLRKRGIISVAIAAEEERNAFHLRSADEKVILKGNHLFETYLNADEMVRIARELRCDAIHPGYGFLSENAAFAELCEQNNILFIGPSSETIRSMGNKLTAREMAEKLGIPVLQSVKGTPDQLLLRAGHLSFPLMIKAAAGGGGKGMRIVADPSALKDALEASSREALAYFREPTVYLEQYLPAPKHIEVQILGDGNGNVVHLWERECSMQRRHQKLVEESPSPSLDPESRKKICDAAVRLAAAARYRSAGTIEFLYSGDGQFFFLEMNTRIQVEHPVTEAITGIDLVDAQLFIAENGRLPFVQEEIPCRGHAIEARIYAEDPSEGFIPSPGLITLYREPSLHGVRIDSATDGPVELSPSYDAMIAKVIVHESSRPAAINRLKASLDDYAILGIKHNLRYLSGLIGHPAFIDGSYHTGFCDIHTPEILSSLPELPQPPLKVAAAGMILGWFFLSADKPEMTTAGNMLPAVFSVFRLRINGRDVSATVFFGTEGAEFGLDGESFVAAWSIDGQIMHVIIDGSHYSILMSNPANRDIWFQINGTPLRAVYLSFNVLEKEGGENEEGLNGSELITAPLHGKIVRINAIENQEVTRGELLMVLEAMKMENQIHASLPGKIKKIFVREGMQVKKNDPLIQLG
ncbi:MAG: biotin carboxylase N-terminal domain-containing protein [Bacteroidales bacterium]